MRVFHSSVIVLLSLLTAVSAWPQTSTAKVSGIVRDESAAVIPAASVALTNASTGLTLRTSVNEAGFYLFPGVVPGPYRLEVEAPGLQKFEGSLTVSVHASEVVDVVLKVQQQATQVTVVDVTPLVTADDSNLGHVLQRERIEQLPLNERKFTTLLWTVPGNEAGYHWGMGIGSIETSLDGTPTVNRYQGYSSWFRQQSMDTIQEIRVENNNASAKYSRPVHLVISTKTGTNQFHGAAFETHRSAAIGQARTRTDFWETAPFYLRNEFGASGGGPVWLPRLYNGRNRTFWFTSLEFLRENQRQNWNASVPTEAMRNGDFSGLRDSRGNQYVLYDPWTTDTKTWQRQPFSYGGQLNRIDPARMSPLAKTLLAMTPLPTRPDVNPLLESNWWGTSPRPRRQWTTTTRIDHAFSDKDRFFGRYTQGDHHTVLYSYMPMLNPTPNSSEVLAPSFGLSLSYTRTISPTFFNEMFASVNRENWSQGTASSDVRWADQLGLPNPFHALGWPTLAGTGLNAYGFASQDMSTAAMTYYVFDDNATKVIGTHELQFGFHLRRDQVNILPQQQAVQGSHSWSTMATSLYDPASTRDNPIARPYTGFDLGNMFLGIMSYNNQLVRNSIYARASEFAFYFQDTYKITPTLTLNLGLRWDYWPPYHEKNGTLASFDIGKRAVVWGVNMDELARIGATASSIVKRFEALGAKFITNNEAGLPRDMVDKNRRDFGPRVGFAQRLGHGQKPLVIRGGYRLSFFAFPLLGWANGLRSNAPTRANFRNDLNQAVLSPDGIRNYMLRSVPAIVAGQNSSNAVTANDLYGLARGDANVYYPDRNQPTSRTHDWNLTLEKPVLPNTVARIGYVGNHGAGLEQWLDINSATPTYIWYATTGLALPGGEYANVARNSWDQVVYGPINQYVRAGWSNNHAVQFELERRYAKGYGYQVFYILGNPLTTATMLETSTPKQIPGTNQYMPGTVPSDWRERNAFINYGRFYPYPKHRVKWNWMVDLPVGRGKPLARNANRLVDAIIGGWRVAGLGTLGSNFFSLPTSIYPTGEKVEVYGYKYPIQDCTSGACYPGYLWWNGYIPADKINSYDAVTGKPNGIMGVPDNYKPAGQPLIPWPKNPNRSDPMYAYYGTNTVWLPMKDGSTQRLSYAPGLHPWQNQYVPSVRQWGMDASLSKAFKFTERVQIRLNADFFNVLNHPNNQASAAASGVLSTRFSGSAAAGDITVARMLQLSMRLNW